MITKELENYVPKGQLEGFPKEIIARMLECQEEQGNTRDISVLEERVVAGRFNEGFSWDKTQEGGFFWHKVINNKDFDFFFERRYPKKDNPQDFRINDKVYDILLKEVGVVQDIVYSSSFIPHGLLVEFKSGLKSYTINGCYLLNSKNPQLFHYIEDYNYNVIDFNNLPKRQEVKRWRAKVGGKYYSFTSNFKVEDYIEINGYFNNEDYNSGNYFKTKEEAQEEADKLNKCFQELINPNN